MTDVKHDLIRRLDDRQKARGKLSIWYGSIENYSHGLKEVIANATDEIINNFDFGTVTVELMEDKQTIKVMDTGRGIPIYGETDGVKNYDLLLRTLFAGTKYEDNENNTTGTNGVGNTVLCFTSKIFNVESYYNGYKHSLKFIDGGEIAQDIKREPCDAAVHGTIIEFKLDSEVYPNITYTIDEVRDIVRRFAVGSNLVRLIFKHNDIEETYHYEELKDYYAEVVGNQSTSPIITAPNTTYNDEDEITQLQLILSTCAEPVQESYLNLTYLSEGGSLHEGIISGVRTFANKYCKDNNLFPKGVKAFLIADIEASISYVCLALSNKVEFQNQTKLSTNKALYRKVARNHVAMLMEILSVENPKGLKKLIDHLLTVQKYNTTAQKAKSKLKSQLSEKVDSISNKIENFIECEEHGAKAEIFIAEGRSALGSIVLARDAGFQAAYPLRGKILNCLKANYSTILKNQVITDLIKVLGCGIKADKANKDLESFDISKLRFGKVIIATDADPDGYQIACLIVTMFYRLMPELVTKGYIYIAKTPLYEVKLQNDEMIYYYSEEEKEANIASIKGKYLLSRCKGLGELTPEVMSETAMNVDTRNLVNITVDDARKMVDTIELWMGIDEAGRKAYIAENLVKFVDDVD